MREDREQEMNPRTAVAQEVAQEPAAVRGDHSVLARAGVALVEFQLLRRGIECVRTPDGSYAGDLWAETSLGKISIEVKTTKDSRSWFVRLNQQRSEFFALVHLDDLAVFLVSKPEMSLICGGMTSSKGTVKVPANRLDDAWREGWQKIGVGRASALKYHPSMNSPEAVSHGFVASRYDPPYIRSWTRQDGRVVYAVRKGNGPHRSAKAGALFEKKVQELRMKGLLLER